MTLPTPFPPGVTATKIAASAEARERRPDPEIHDGMPRSTVTGTVTCTYEEASRTGPPLPGATIVVTIVVSVPEGVYALAPTPRRSPAAARRAPRRARPRRVGEADRPLRPLAFDVDVWAKTAKRTRRRARTRSSSRPRSRSTSPAREAGGNGRRIAARRRRAQGPRSRAAARASSAIRTPSRAAASRRSWNGKSLNCPLDTQVGTIKPFFYGTFSLTCIPVFNIAPPPGQPAELGFSVAGVGHIPLFFRVRERRGLRAHRAARRHPRGRSAAGRDPDAVGRAGGREPRPRTRRHARRRSRSNSAVRNRRQHVERRRRTERLPERHRRQAVPDAAQRLPGSREPPVRCDSDSWEDPQPPLRPLAARSTLAAAFTGCEQLSFDPSLTLAPETPQAGAPSGYTLDAAPAAGRRPERARRPRPARRAGEPAGRRRDLAVGGKRPAGVLAPSSSQLAEPGTRPAACPPQSQIGTVKIITPLLSSPLEGQVFLGEPECAPCTRERRRRKAGCCACCCRRRARA